MGYRIPITLGNIEPLAYKPFRPGKMALVCEGGGQRGIFTAGVLDELQRARFNPFELMIGTSAGAQNLSAFICGQMGYARRVITRYTTSANFFNPLRFVRGGHLIDLDWLIDITSQQLPLALDVAEQHLSNGRELLMCACRSDDFEPTYLRAERDNWLPAIKASSAIPGFYRQGVELDGVSYLDGGISAAIPVEEAYRRGADTIVVIRTVPSQMYYTPQWLKRMEHWLSDSSLQQMVRIMQQHEQSYHRIQQFIEQPPGKLRIFEIFPPKPLASNALGSRLPALNQDYHLGRRCGRYFLATVGHWLLEQEQAGGSKVEPLVSRRLLQPESVRMPSPIATAGGHPHSHETARATAKIVLPHAPAIGDGDAP
ncbi:patatin-like phospholipase family protein [Serratia oryzae]|uniref:patatin-like phospholipase family protein n=1 Tax=Serratia oryzae TaxID=2034155 RepID=UPI0012E19934|nr:patatin family protein [Serratia oryzae]